MPRVKFDTEGILEPVKEKNTTEEQSNPSLGERAWGFLSSRNLSYVTGGIMTATVLGLAPFAATSATAGIAALSIGTVGTIAGYMVNNVASARKSRRDTLEEFEDLKRQQKDNNYEHKQEAITAYANTHYALNVVTNAVTSIGVAVGSSLLAIEQYSGAAAGPGVQSYLGAAIACGGLAVSVSMQAYTNSRFSKVRNNYKQKLAEYEAEATDMEKGLTNRQDNEITQSVEERNDNKEEEHLNLDKDNSAQKSQDANVKLIEKYEERILAAEQAAVEAQQQARAANERAELAVQQKEIAERVTTENQQRAYNAEHRAKEAERNALTARELAHKAQEQAEEAERKQQVAEEKVVHYEKELKSAFTRIEGLKPLLERLEGATEQIEKDHASSSTSSPFPKSRQALAPGARLVSAVKATTIIEEKVESDKSSTRKNSLG